MPEEIRRLARDGNALQPEAASSISSGLSIVGKIIGNGALTIFGHVEGEVRASTIVIAEGAQIEGEVSAEELTIGGYVKGTINANCVKLNSTAVVEGDIFHRTMVIEGSDASMKSARGIVRWNRNFGRALPLSARAAGSGGGSYSIATAKVTYISVRCRSTECSNFLDAFGDGFRQLHHHLAQFVVFLNLALDAFAIGPQLFPQPLKLTNEIVN